MTAHREVHTPVRLADDEGVAPQVAAAPTVRARAAHRHGAVFLAVLVAAQLAWLAALAYILWRVLG